jgi:hypothetical protein
VPERPLVDNAADAQQVRDGRRKEKDAKQQLSDDLREIVGTPAGKRFIRALLTTTHPFELSHVADPLQTAFREGERNVGQWLIATLIEAEPAMAGAIITTTL